jgi:uncharacterized protein
MSNIIDRRLNQGNKNLGNRQRFIRKAKAQIKKSIRKGLNNRSISDTTSGEQVQIPLDGIREPNFGHNPRSGVREGVLPGNREYTQGDRIKKPSGGGSGDGRGSKPSDSPDTGEDDFEFTLTKDEFYDMFFEDLELPDLIRKKLRSTDSWELSRAGISSAGNPSNLHVVRTMKQSISRRLVLRKPHERELAELQAQLDSLDENHEHRPTLEAQIHALKKKIRGVSYVDPIDLRYKVFEQRPKPSTTAVMMCVMDVSGSMDEHKKDLAKRFFMLLYLFLQRKYERVIVEFIRHHTEAERVDENTFFYDKMNGGTKVSSALELVCDLIHKEYDPSLYNVYVCQASDGDNWDNDNQTCAQILENQLLPQLQYMAYVEISDIRELGEYPLLQYSQTKLYQTYEKVSKQVGNLQVTRVWETKEIYAVFRELFERK